MKHEFRTHVEHFLNRHFRSHFEDMIGREKALLQLVSQLQQELEKRRSEGNIPRILPGEKVDNYAADMFKQYDDEIEGLVRTFGEADSLRSSAAQSGQKDVAGDLAEMNSDLMEALDLDTDIYLYEKKPQHLYTEYLTETEELLELYKRLVDMDPAFNDALRDEIAFQKQEIRDILVPGSDEQLRAFSNEFVKEMNLLDGLIARIDGLQEVALKKNAALAIELAGLRKSVAASLDKRIVAMLEKPSYRGPALLQLFREWQARDVAQFERSRAQHQIMRKKLIACGSGSQVARMRNREMTAALLNFSRQDFALAARQFEAMVTAYPSSDFDADVRFYLAESYYQDGNYRDAFAAFENVVERDNGSEYGGDALFRIVSIARMLGKPLQAMHYSKVLVQRDPKTKPDIRDRAFYLAGITLLQGGLQDDAMRSFDKVMAESRLREMSLYLSGTALVAKGDLERAAAVFQEVVSHSHWSSDEAILSFPANASMWKLALLEYQAGDYQAALAWLERIDTGFENLDDCLIAAAWANLNLGNAQETLRQLNAFLKTRWDSQSLYEARVLAAYCKQNLRLDDSATDDFEYVYNALRIEDLTAGYFDERDFVLRQLDHIDVIDEAALNTLDETSHDVAMTMRDQEEERLAGFRYTGAPDNSVMRRFDEERKQIIEQMADLDEVIATATELGLSAEAEDARYQQQRLAEALLKWQPDGDLNDVTFFSTHPVAAKEGLLQRREEKHARIADELAIERRKLSRLQDANQALALSAGENDDVRSSISKLEVALSGISHDVEQLDTWVARNRIEEKHEMAMVQQWANLASAEMTEIAFMQIRDTDEELAQLAVRTRKVNELLADRETTLQERLKLYEDQVRKLEKALIEEQLLEQEQERTRHFETEFFDTSERESGLTQPAGEEAK